MVPIAFLPFTLYSYPPTPFLEEMMRLVSLCLLALPCLIAAGGCSSRATETGYEPQRLGMSDGQRKALYAPKYSLEATQAAAESGQSPRSRKPGGFMQ